jgi:hypothetical protein
VFAVYFRTIVGGKVVQRIRVAMLLNYNRLPDDGQEPTQGVLTVFDQHWAETVYSPVWDVLVETHK